VKIGGQIIGIEFGQQRGGRIGRDPVSRPADQIERIGIHHLQRTRTQLEQLRHRLADILETLEMN
jgi:hypothetical protein